MKQDLQTFVTQLQAAKVENARRELILLLAFIQNRPYSEVFFDPGFNVEDYDRLSFLVQRRCEGEPLSKITGQREFWSLPFKVTTDTLDPRPDSETIIQAVLLHFPDRHHPFKIVDFGTGTGCLLLSVLSEYPNSLGMGVDISDAALTVAKENAQQLKLQQRTFFIRSSWAKKVQGKFDILISNPPYIRLNESLEPAVKHYDPPYALYGGEDGLEAYRTLLPQLHPLMYSHSLAFIEIGKDQGDAVRSIGKEAGLTCVATYLDLASVERTVVFGKALRFDKLGVTFPSCFALACLTIFKLFC